MPGPLDTLLDGVPREHFLSQYLFRQPFSLPQAALPLVEQITPDLLRQILDQPGAAPIDLLAAKDGARFDGALPKRYEQLSELHDQGYTVLIRHAERHQKVLAELSLRFREEFQAPVDLHLYWTPAGEHGFGWHYDAEEVFLLQCQGVKAFSLRKNTVHPWPLLETMPQDLRYERELMPLMKCRLHAGDWLYIPSGWWHVAEAIEDSLTLAAGVLAPSGIDLLDQLRSRLLNSPFWRKRLPHPHASNDEWDETFTVLAEDLAREFRSQEFRNAWQVRSREST